MFLFLNKMKLEQIPEFCATLRDTLLRLQIDAFWIPLLLFLTPPVIASRNGTDGWVDGWMAGQVLIKFARPNLTFWLKTLLGWRPRRLKSGWR